jgi:hypothetical protein
LVEKPVRERDHLEDPGVDGRVILIWVFKKQDGLGGVEWTDLAQNGDMWQAVVNAVMNVRLP